MANPMNRVNRRISWVRVWFDVDSSMVFFVGFKRKNAKRDSLAFFGFLVLAYPKIFYYQGLRSTILTTLPPDFLSINTVMSTAFALSGTKLSA